MDWVVDHGVALAAIALGAMVVPAIAVLAVRVLALVRTVKASRRGVEPPIDALRTESARVEVRIQRVMDGHAEASAAAGRLAVRIGEIRVLARHAARGLAILRSPLRYLGR